MDLSLQETAEALSKANKIALTAHVNPDGDAVGSVLGLMHILKGIGKEAIAFIDDKLPANFSFLPGIENIKKPEESGGKIPADLLVILDASPDRIGKVQDMIEAPVVNIDHHVSNEGKEVRLYLDAKRAATCEIVYELAKELRSPFTKEIATCLYTGIATDTGFFRYANTTPLTMRAAAELMEYGVEPNTVSEATEQKPYDTVRGMADALKTMEIFHGGKAAGLFLDEELSERIENTEGFIDMIRVIEGVEVALLLKCKEKDVFRVSMRSKGLDVSKIAMSFEGGGHVRAAGCTLNMSFSDAKKTIVDAVDKALDDY